ncbi:MAG: hypothetical protein U1D41_16235 [Nitrosomonas sp.]|jgi:hypothetical protein|uniref:hypothetical protein n=1 Tax=Nitrosomonas sp. TaxID=42353 RepID=UPI002719DC31|nr:hypothetical protein [Nitrosomonas sp.]MBK6958206.1 hypothetical protein [Nitrosomonas sp.]MDO8894717.1 hypothetical protein [Nitrosomonas sp.]MDO9470751.1 hypothetical protein [Nitrosomonas sp.]MDP1548861.1 hypothetical protein [Nitrosomonas sp.]MDP1785925.1 hypothetical protein [Nitrosomonas sp.]
MEDAEIALMFSLLTIPVAIWLQLWVKNRREKRRNDLGEEEFENTSRAFISIISEGTAIVGGLIMIIMGCGGVIKYVLNFYAA